jgi:plasmid stabilization system protein ParE
VKRRYKLTPQARYDLLSIWEFIARDNIRAAGRLAERMEAAFRLLARFPQTGHKRVDVDTSEPVLFWPVGSYVVAYRPEPRPLVILRILHGARDLGALF